MSILNLSKYSNDQAATEFGAGRLQSEQAANVCRQWLNSGNVNLLDEMKACRNLALLWSPKVPSPEKSGLTEEDPGKSAAAAVAAQLIASTSSAQMLSYVLSFLAQEGVIGNAVKESPIDYTSDKKPKLENDQSSCVSLLSQHLPLPPFQHPDALPHNVAMTSVPAKEQPPPPPLPPLLPMQPYPMPPLMQTARP
ncbi:hypothetical protein Ancab_033402 [Ancistrocladus abbreviatus]